MDRKLYGPYNVRDIYAYLNLTYSLDPLSRAEIEKLEPLSKLNAVQTNSDSDWNPYAGQLVYNAELLLTHHALAPYPSMVAAIQVMMERKETRLVTENDLILFLFAYAEEYSRVRIFLFARVARMFYSLMLNAVPPKEGVVVKMKSKADKCVLRIVFCVEFTQISDSSERMQTARRLHHTDATAPPLRTTTTASARSDRLATATS